MDSKVHMDNKVHMVPRVHMVPQVFNKKDLQIQILVGENPKGDQTSREPGNPSRVNPINPQDNPKSKGYLLFLKEWKQKSSLNIRQRWSKSKNKFNRSRLRGKRLKSTTKLSLKNNSTTLLKSQAGQ